MLKCLPKFKYTEYKLHSQVNLSIENLEFSFVIKFRYPLATHFENMWDKLFKTLKIKYSKC